jgi:predicted DNA-binding transcriptional regulator AlpA
LSKDLTDALAEGRAVNVPPLARALGLSRVGLYAAVKRGEVPSIRIGRRVVIPAAVARRLLGLEEKAA